MLDISSNNSRASAEKGCVGMIFSWTHPSGKKSVLMSAFTFTAEFGLIEVQLPPHATYHRAGGRVTSIIEGNHSEEDQRPAHEARDAWEEERSVFCVYFFRVFFFVFQTAGLALLSPSSHPTNPNPSLDCSAVVA